MIRIERHRYDPGLSEIHRASAACAMIHTGHHEEPIELPDAIEPAIRGDHPIEVVDRSAGEDQLIGPTMVGDYLAAVATEFGEIRVVGADDVMELLLRLPEPGLKAGSIHA